MKIFKVAEKVIVGLAQSEWIDICSSQFEDQMRDYINRVKNERPTVVLSLRMIEETELVI